MFQEPFFELSYPTNIKPEIILKKSDCKFDKNAFHELEESVHQLSEKKKQNTKLVEFQKKINGN